MPRDKFWATSLPDKTSSAPNDVKSSYDELMLGVWRVLVMKDRTFWNLDSRWESFHTTFAFVLRALRDVYTIDPRLFVLFLVTRIWFAIEGPLSLYFSNRLFFLIEKLISGGFVDGRVPSDLYFAAISRVACSLLNGYISWASRRVRHAYVSRIKYEFQARIFNRKTGVILLFGVSDMIWLIVVKLACDLQTAQEQGGSTIDIDDVHDCLEQGIIIINQVISFLLQLRLVVHIIGSGLNDGGPIFLTLCVLPPLMEQFAPAELWTRAYVVSPANKSFIRKSALEKLSDSGLKQEVMAGGADEYLMNEYRIAKDSLGDIPDIQPEILYAQEREATPRIIMKLFSSDGPTLYFALLALFSPSKLSIVQLAVLDQISTSLRFTFLTLKHSVAMWPSVFARMRNVYAVLDIKNKMKDGETPFPRPGYEASEGMRIQVQDVSFSYPHTKSDCAALTGVSFTIQPGQLVVIVGANGSGKSTIIKLLSRFYDPTSGSILIDGLPIEEYRMNELRKGIAMLTQEHQLFPLSIRENIQLGSSNIEAMKDEGMVKASVLASGAEGIMKNFSDGYDTVLEPVSTGYVSYAGHGNRRLEAVHKKLEKQTNISGGEKQKLVAARTFMRLFTSPVKVVTVDEPSSALDPEAEYQLFNNLRQERKGRTMIFVTHRFGHLTKHADLIICLKEGTVVETGTHVDLLSRGGEYAQLYNIQAQAFATA